MRLYIIRHGHVTYRRGVPFASVPPKERSLLPDPALTEMGRRQAALLGEHMSRGILPEEHTQPLPHDRLVFAITRLFCSPMRRALQTARPVAAALGLRPEIWLGLHESTGLWHDEGDGRGARGVPGLTRVEVEEQFPEFVIPPDFADDGWWNRPPETEAEYLPRLQRVAQDIRAMAVNSDEHIAIVSHGTASNYILHGLLGSKEYEKVYFNHAHTGMSNLIIEENETTVRYQNSVQHLPADMITG